MSVTISGTDGITFPDASVQAKAAIGEGQTWQNLTASRALSTVYTNSTGKPIQVSIDISASTNGFATMVIDGVDCGRLVSQTISGTIDASCQHIVPNGATYTVTTGGTVTLRTWAELR